MSLYAREEAKLNVCVKPEDENQINTGGVHM